MKAKFAALVYPHQLWENHPAVARSNVIFLIEDPLFFSQYNFHCQKLVLHRASMTEFAANCQRLGKLVFRIESSEIANSSEIGSILHKRQVQNVLAIDPTDDWLKKRVSQGCDSAGIAIEWLEDPAFLTPDEVMHRWADDRQHYRFTDFYMQQRKRLSVLLDANGKPWGGKWTFDTENRKKLPKGIVVPEMARPAERASVLEAKKYVAKQFPNAIGQIQEFIYPVTYEDSKSWLSDFVDARLATFGDYEDAISQSETFVFHSVLTPMLNIGLLTPQQVIESVLEKADDVSLNSLEGFMRQVIDGGNLSGLSISKLARASELEIHGGFLESFQLPFMTERLESFHLIGVSNAH